MNDSQNQSVVIADAVITLENVGETVLTILTLEDWTDYQQSVANVAGQITENSARVYTSEAKLFASWLQEHGYQELTREAIIAYH